MSPMVKQMNIHRIIANLLLICFSAFLGHNLVPHQHFSEDLGDSCTAKDQHLPHCHAFNDVEFEKFNRTIYNPQSSQIQDMAESGQVGNPEELLPSPNSLYTFLEPACSSRAVRGTHDLRAPPSFG